LIFRSSARPTLTHEVYFMGTAIVGGAFAAVIFFLITFAILKSFLYIGRPNEILIFSGGEHKQLDGSTRGYRLIRAGFAVRNPLIETVDRLDLRVIPVNIHIKGAYSKGGIPLNVHAIANIKISKDPQKIGQAIERFLGRDRSEIMRVAQETLEGNLRGVLATLTPEEVNESREKFAKQLLEEASDDLRALGLELDTLKIRPSPMIRATLTPSVATAAPICCAPRARLRPRTAPKPACATPRTSSRRPSPRSRLKRASLRLTPTAASPGGRSRRKISNRTMKLIIVYFVTVVGKWDLDY